MTKQSNRIKVFLLYAEEDLALKAELETHLSLLHQKGLIDIWDEGRIVFYKNAEDHIREQLEQAQLILLLISSNFLVPEVYGKYEEDLQAAYQRQQAGKTQIIPIILRPCLWELDLLKRLDPLPKGGYPVRSRHWDSHDLAFQNIALGILNIVDELKKEATPAKPPPLPAQKKAVNPSNKNQDQIALSLINDLFSLLQQTNPDSGARLILPILHKSLIKQGQIDANFKKVKFQKAYEKVWLYESPAMIKEQKSSGRKTIGVFLDQEKGEEWIYTLKKIRELGGISGQIRIFFPENGDAAKISSISL